MKIAYYITAHGYGHGARSCDIIGAINRLRPDAAVLIVTDLPAEFLRSRLPSPGIKIRTASFDSGMFQLDSVRVDLERSLAAAASVQLRRPELIAAERSFLRAEKIDVVVADIPAIPIAAAKEEDLRALAVGNFGWDWIYEDFIPHDARWTPIVESFRRDYARADLLLKLPFAEPMSAFPRQTTLPLVSARGQNRRIEIARHCNAAAEKPWVLLSFTTLDWNDGALDRVSHLDGFEFFTVSPLAWPERANIHTIDRRAFPFVDVLATCDLVASKPGYGILSECAVNDRPFVYVEREHFREYPVLEAAIHRHLRGVHIPSQKLYAGELGDYLSAALCAPPAREPLAGDNGDSAARAILGAM